MVLEAAGIEIGTEPTPRPRRHTLGAQYGNQQHGEMPADADVALADRASGRERLAVMGEEAIQHPLYGANVRFAPALVGQRDAVGWCKMLVQQQPLHDAREIGDLAGQSGEQLRMPAGRCHRRGACIEVEDVLPCHGKAHAQRTDATGGRWVAMVDQLRPPSADPNTSPDVAPK